MNDINGLYGISMALRIIAATYAITQLIKLAVYLIKKLNNPKI